MIKKIGVENFRVFKEYTEFELRPITLLTGPNNSGKSSFTKLLLLLQNGLEHLNFKVGNHNLENFESILSWESGNKDLRIRMNSGIPFFKDIDVEYIYVKGVIERINLVQNEIKILEFKHKFDGPHEDWDMWAGDIFNYQYYTLDIEGLIDLIYENEFRIHNNYRHYTKCPDEKWITADSPDILKESKTLEKGELTKRNYRENFLGAFDLYPGARALYAITNEVDLLKKDYLLYNVSFNGTDKSKDLAVEIRELQKIAFENIEFHDDPEDPSAEFDTEYFDRFTHNLSEIQYRAEEKFQALFEERYPDTEIKVTTSQLHEILFEEKWFNYSKEYPEKGKTLFEQFEYIANDNTKNLKNIDYISANRGSQKRVLQNTSDNEIDKLIVEYLEKGNKYIDFLQEALEILGIKGKLTIERYQNTISVVYLEHNDKKISLADLGYGFSQIIPIFLKMLLIGQNYNSKILIIEEPEANLHPALQSKFADILKLAIKEFPGMSFILETHSEYLIRKLQYLVAKKELSPEASIIYYFNTDEALSHQEPKVKKIEITETGNLTANFGPGFFDEATRLQFDLMKIKKEQEN